MIKENEIAYILVADGSIAKIFEAYRENGELEVSLLDYFTNDRTATKDIGTERPGRVFDSKGSNRHAAEPKVDFHQQAETQFVNDMVSLLENLYNKHVFHKLVLVAAPRALGDIRKSLSKQLKNIVIKEIDKDLTKTETEEIKERLLKELVL